MPTIKAFKGVRPASGNISSVPIKNFDSYSQEEIEKSQSDTGYSYLNVLSPMVDDTLTYDEKCLSVRNNFNEFLQRGYLEQDDAQSLYLYRQEFSDGQTVTGIIALISLDEETKSAIKPHENIHDHRVTVFADYLSKTHLNSEPILMTFKSNNTFVRIVDLESRKTPIYELEMDDVKHTLWQIDNRLIMRQTIESYEIAGNFYIADGHHRFSSSIEYANSTDLPSAQFALAYIIPLKDLIISDYNRVVKAPGLNKAEFLKKLNENFRVSNKGDEVYYPSQSGIFGMYLEGNFYSVRPRKNSISTDDPLNTVDMHLCDKYIISEILDVDTKNPKGDVKFVIGKGSEESSTDIQKEVDENGYDIGFFFYPILPQKLVDIAEMGLSFPPKSTYIEPRLLSGLLVYDMERD